MGNLQIAVFVTDTQKVTPSIKAYGFQPLMAAK